MTIAWLVRVFAVMALFAFASPFFETSLPHLALGTAEAHHARDEGFGAVTTGGAGQPECVVTSLADRGPGTLRACLSQGHRYVTFRVAGTIVLNDWLDVMGPYVTIDGFSAPAPGITITGWGLGLYRNVSTRTANTHDVIVRGLRFRDAGLSSSSGDCISIIGETYNIIIDHVSIAGCGDGAIDVSTGPRRVSIQWSILATPKVMLLGTTSSGGKLTEHVSLHHNYFAAGSDRFPLVRSTDTPARSTTVDIRQNIFRGWLRANGTKIETGTWVNLVGNTYIPRPETSLSHIAGSVQVSSESKTFTAQNVELVAGMNYNGYGNLSAPHPAPTITARPAGCVIAHAGVHPRDDVDQEFVDAVRDLVGSCLDVAPPPSDPIVTVHPDLAPTSLQAPGSATAGETIAVSTKITNAGSGAAGGSTARLDFINGSTSSTSVVDSFAVPSLAAGTSYSTTRNVTIPAGTTGGSYSIRVLADAAGAVAESSETNNALSIAFTVQTSSTSTDTSTKTSSLPDLVVLDPRSPYNVTSGGTYRLEFTANNTGTASSGRTQLRFFLSSDKSLSRDDVDLGVSVPVPGLAPGAKYRASDISVKLPSSSKTGRAYILFVLDPLNAVVESNEDNNVRNREIFIQ